jgi:hypothetical protein
MCRGELHKANDQPQMQTSVNSIRPGRLASRRRANANADAATADRFTEIIKFAEMPADYQGKAVSLLGDFDPATHAAGQGHAEEVLQLFDLPRELRLLRHIALGGLGEISRLHHPQQSAQAVQGETGNVK